MMIIKMKANALKIYYLFKNDINNFPQSKEHNEF